MWRLVKAMLALSFGAVIAVAPIVGTMVYQRNLSKQKTAPWR